MKLILFLALILLLAGCSEPVPIEELDAFEFSITERDYYLGIGYWPTYKTNEIINNDFEQFSQGAEVAYVQIADNMLDETKDSASLEVKKDWLKKAKENNKKIYIALECIEGSRDKIKSLPGKEVESFADVEFREAFKAKAIEWAQTYKPEYLNLCVEINMLPDIDSESENFVSLYNEIYSEVKKISPETKMFVSYQFEFLTGDVISRTKKSQWDLIEKLGEKQDLIGISSYPRVMQTPYNPHELSDDHFLELNKYATKPIFFAETGAYSGGSIFSNSSETIQAKYIVRLTELIEPLDVEAVMWISLKALPDIPELKAFIPDWFFSLGLQGSKNEEKLSWVTWKKLKSLPKN